jgi:uncharacterized protein (DUF1786 family)
MHILAVDIGTGTQDILLWDTAQEPENALQLIMPAPTQRVAAAIRAATAAGETLVLSGDVMGGGPCGWAAQEHVRAGLRLYATPAAACTFDDDPEAVRAMGVAIVGEDEAAAIEPARRIRMRDLDLEAIAGALRCFDVELAPDAIGVAVFDHGAAPPGVSDRRYRFEYLARRLSAHPEPAALAYMAQDIPQDLSRMRAVARSGPAGSPLLVMDTPSAAVLGALEDPLVRRAGRVIAVNVGNGHTLAFRMEAGQVTGLFEHHTGKLSPAKLDGYIQALADGTIDDLAVYADNGHGALLLRPGVHEPELVSVTGPRRRLMSASRYRPYFAVPYGDMMVAGCWGLVRALAARAPALAGEIEAGLARGA